MRNLSITLTNKKDEPFNRPVELYEVDFASSGSYYYAAHDRDVVFDGQTYEAYDISRGTLSTNATLRKQQVDVDIGNIDLEAASLYQNISLGESILTLYKVFLDALDDPSNIITLFQGKIDRVEVSERNVSLTVIGNVDVIDMQVPGRRYKDLTGTGVGV